ncbi:MAG: DUF3575 domain-containing protein [Bacteroidetes bacterium]|nr:DUF3575 domain-containing protein [Bacteroidota bacterium]
MKKYLFFFFLFPALNGWAQHDSIRTDVKLNVLAPMLGLADISLEHRLCKNFSLTGEFGYQVYGFPKGDTQWVKPSGYRAIVELRRYNLFGGGEKYYSLTGWYCGVDLFYKYNRYNETLTYLNENDTLTHHDSFSMEKNVFGGNLILGYQSVFAKHFCFDIHGGPGMMYRSIIDHNIEFGMVHGDYFSGGKDLAPFFAEQDYRASSGTTFSLRFSLGIGYIIN